MGPDSCPELRDLGLCLKRARECKGLSLDQQANRLCMGTEQLAALEQGDARSLPEPVFIVAQARRVAASLGVSIDAEIAALRASPVFQGQPVQASAPAPSPPRPPSSRAHSRQYPWLLAASALALVGVLAWGMQQMRQARSTSDARLLQPPLPPPLAPPLPLPLPLLNPSGTGFVAGGEHGLVLLQGDA